MRLRLAAMVLVFALRPTLARADEDNLQPREILSVMSSRRLQIRKLCYESSPAKADTSVRLDVTVSGSGQVIDVQQREPSGPEEIRACIVAEMKKTTFPGSAKGGWFRWPFIFKGP